MNDKLEKLRRERRTAAVVHWGAYLGSLLYLYAAISPGLNRDAALVATAALFVAGDFAERKYYDHREREITHAIQSNE